MTYRVFWRSAQLQLMARADCPKRTARSAAECMIV